MGNCALPMQTAPADFQGLKIICHSWKKTYAHLHDYNADPNHVSVIPYMLLQDTRVYKTTGKYDFTPHENKDKNKQKEMNADGVLDVLQDEGKKKTGGQGMSYRISGKILKAREQPWVVVKSLPKKGYVLKEGDILRIGKQKVKVKEIMEKTQEQKQNYTIDAKGIIYEDLTKEGGEPKQCTEQQINTLSCRFCFDQGQLGNPLISPCKCMGSSKYVHLGCLQKWMVNTINPRPYGKATAITWKPLSCELCHESLPFKVYLDGRSYYIVNMADLKPAKPYLVLNPIYRSKQLGKNKIYLMVSFAEQKEMVLGRKSDTDILISSDSTVGRNNSKIVYESKMGPQGRFVLYDLDSKFGTLVLLRKPFHMVHELNGLSIQFGGDVLQFKVGNRAKNPGDVDLDDPINHASHEKQEQEYDEDQQKPQPQQKQENEHEHQPEQMQAFT